ncbi:MAG: YceI family protein [Vulcanimicrobiota bacterium]
MHKNRLLKILISLLFLLTVHSIALADTYEVDPAHSTLNFSVGHLGLTDIDGRFGDFSGTIQWSLEDPENTSISFTAQAKSIDTGVEQRDDHLRTPDFFDAETHPTLNFESTRVTHLGENRYRVDGDLTIHGVTKAITTTARIIGPKEAQGTEKIGFRTTFAINRLDYKVGEGKFSSDAMIGHTVFIEVKGEANRAK